jgi:hypothetical protein
MIGRRRTITDMTTRLPIQAPGRRSALQILQIIVVGSCKLRR